MKKVTVPMQTQLPSTPLHKHHILPRHAGGSDDDSNIIHLTVEQHSLAHKQLYERFGRWQDRLAWLALSGIVGHEEAVSESAKKGGETNKGRIKSKSHCQNLSLAKLGKKYGPHSKEHKEKISKGLKGKRKPPRTEEHNINHAIATSKQFRIIFPTGNSSIITNMSQFCREYSLNQGRMIQVARGKEYQHKGYRCSYVV
jgi:hypothetical protein